MRNSRWRDWLFGGQGRPLAAFLAAASLFIPPPLGAYHRHLSEDDVREAYLFGQRRGLSVGKFFDAYEKRFTYTANEPSVRAIGVRSPYAAVVLRSHQGGNTYSAQQAWKDYTERARVFEVVIWIDIPFRSPVPQNRAFDPAVGIQQMFTVELNSQEQVLASQKALLMPQYFPGGDFSTLSGAEMHIEYDVQSVASDTARIQVTSKAGKTVTADFDLAALR